MDYSRKHEKKHKKTEKKKHKKEKKHSSSSSESEEEWIERKDQDIKTPERNSKREEWMSVEMDFTSFSTKKEKEKVVKRDDQVSEKEQLGQSSRELNPYWRDGGTGLPPTDPIKTTSVSRQDHKDKIKDSERGKNYGSAEYSDKRKSENKVLEQSERHHSKTYEQTRRDYHTKSNRQDMKYGSGDYDRKKYNTSFLKPKHDEISSNEQLRQERTLNNFSEKKYENYRSSSSKKSWKKDRNEENKEKISDVQENTKQINKTYESPMDSEIPSNNDINIVDNDYSRVLSRDELNKLCAKIMKAEMMGNMKLAEELEHQLKNARKSSKSGKQNNGTEINREVIILTETDSKGFTRPLKSVQQERLNLKRKIETHEDNKRMRYFADDDSQSLQDMFEKERFSSTREQNSTFMKLMGKEISLKDEDAFEETASVASTSLRERKNWDQAIKENNRREKALDNCYWCMGSKNMNQDVIVAVKNKIQLCVPSTQSLTEGHCIIVPNEHISCVTNLDEDVWEDIMNLKKKLVQVFEAEEEDIIFFECASNLDKHPHMQLHCVPVPKETGDVAPIYFKKAIMECEAEWSNNKKVVDLKGRNVRKAIPKGLPYFAVDFGLQPGYAHVIEDKQLFPNNFAQEIIGGMLDIEHSKWRKLHKDSEENIERKAKHLKELIQKY